jgi:signal transduction histidine kinase
LAQLTEVAFRAGLLLDNARLAEQAREALRLRDQMLALVTHDLRNPLGSLALTIELLERTEAPTPIRRLTEMLRTGVDQMSHLVSDLGDLGQMESGRFRVNCKVCDLAPALRRTLDLLGPLAHDRGLSLQSRIQERLEGNWDVPRIQQALGNLLGNALKFTPTGGNVEISAEADDRLLRIQVDDTGPGIPVEERERIFERFYQLSRDRKQGSGLGLYITHNIVQAHGGTIRVEGRPAVGSRFVVEIPVLPPSTP